MCERLVPGLGDFSEGSAHGRIFGASGKVVNPLAGRPVASFRKYPASYPPRAITSSKRSRAKVMAAAGPTVRRHRRCLHHLIGQAQGQQRDPDRHPCRRHHRRPRVPLFLQSPSLLRRLSPTSFLVGPCVAVSSDPVPCPESHYECESRLVGRRPETTDRPLTRPLHFVTLLSPRASVARIWDGYGMPTSSGGPPWLGKSMHRVQGDPGRPASSTMAP